MTTTEHPVLPAASASAPSVDAADSTQTPEQAALAAYNDGTARVLEGLILSPRPQGGLTARQALLELEHLTDRARDAFERTARRIGATTANPARSASVWSVQTEQATPATAAAITPTPDQRAIWLYLTATARALEILVRNGRRTGAHAQPARQAAGSVLWEARHRVHEVLDGEAQRKVAEAALTEAGSDHWMRAHACVPYGKNGWIHQHLGLRIEREPHHTDASWLRCLVTFVECIPPEANKPGPGHYDPEINTP
jgi:hypothetical protein